MTTGNILVIIPARSGSKGIKNKNIYHLKKKPLLAHSILTAKKCKFKNIIVSTDSKKYSKIAKYYGAEVPFLRPKNISNDKSLDDQYLRHCYRWYEKNRFKINTFIILRPTTPFRSYLVVKNALKIFKKKKLTFLRSAHEASESPLKWFKRNSKGFFKPIVRNLNFNVTNLGRQNFDKVYIPNGYVDILSTKFIKNKNIYGKRMYVFETERTFEIDTNEDIKILEKC
jgi:CMP-N,N'-diacetyllegionaminic acid synthase